MSVTDPSLNIHTQVFWSPVSNFRPFDQHLAKEIKYTKLGNVGESEWGNGCYRFLFTLQDFVMTRENIFCYSYGVSFVFIHKVSIIRRLFLRLTHQIPSVWWRWWGWWCWRWWWWWWSCNWIKRDGIFSEIRSIMILEASCYCHCNPRRAMLQEGRCNSSITSHLIKQDSLALKGALIRANQLNQSIILIMISPSPLLIWC